MLGFLEHHLMAATRVQMEMQERRLELRRRYAVFQRPAPAPASASFAARSGERGSEDGPASSPSAAELVLLESENEALLQELENDLDQVR
jgi:hypothetical protein